MIAALKEEKGTEKGKKRDAKRCFKRGKKGRGKGEKNLIKEAKYDNFPFLVGSTASKEETDKGGKKEGKHK